MSRRRTRFPDCDCRGCTLLRCTWFRSSSIRSASSAMLRSGRGASRAGVRGRRCRCLMTESVHAGRAFPPPGAKGAFLAFAAGDALGWPQEVRGNVPKEVVGTVAHEHFRSWTRRAGGRFGPYEEAIQPGDYSDDTQLTLAVARSRTNHAGAWWQAWTRIELPLWTVYERGGGSATKRAAGAWARGHAPWKSRREGDVRRYFNAGGNGVAMRVLPHALFLAGEESAAGLVHDVVLDGSATHGHPRALVGAAVYAYAAWCLARRTGTLRFGELLDTLIDEESAWHGFPQSDRNRKTWFEAACRAAETPYDGVWDRTAHEMRELLETARKGIQAGALADDHSVLKDLGCFGQAKGAGTTQCGGGRVPRSAPRRAPGAGCSQRRVRQGRGHGYARGDGRRSAGLPCGRRVDSCALASGAGCGLPPTHRLVGSSRGRRRHANSQ